jgi:hypothetical protein
MNDDQARPSLPRRAGLWLMITVTGLQTAMSGGAAIGLFWAGANLAKLSIAGATLAAIALCWKIIITLGRPRKKALELGLTALWLAAVLGVFESPLLSKSPWVFLK